MKIIILFISILIAADATIAGNLPPNLVNIISENIRDVPGNHHEPYRAIQKLCLEALGEEISENDLVVLTDFAAGNKTITHSAAESFWRKAANSAVFNMDGDVDRLYALAFGEHQDAAIAALNVLCQLNADPTIGDFFIHLFIQDWKQGVTERDSRRGEWCAIVAAGMVRHGGHKLGSEIVPFMGKRVIDQAMMISLFFAAVEQDEINDSITAIIRSSFMQTMDPFYLKDMSSALRKVGKDAMIANKYDQLNNAIMALAP